MATEDVLSGLPWSERTAPEDPGIPNFTIPVGLTYNNAFLMLTKYGEMSIGVRNGVYVQGSVILSASGYLYYKQEFVLSLFVALFCGMMTVVLHILHQHYNAYFFSVREYIRFLEVLYCRHLPVGYVDYVEQARDRRVGTGRFGWMRNHGSFSLIGLSTLAIACASVAQLTVPSVMSKLKARNEAAEAKATPAPPEVSGNWSRGRSTAPEAVVTPRRPVRPLPADNRTTPIAP